MNFGGFRTSRKLLRDETTAQANYGTEFAMPPDEIVSGALALTDRGIALTLSQPTTAVRLDPFLTESVTCA